jgi:hypothetical protein
VIGEHPVDDAAGHHVRFGLILAERADARDQRFPKSITTASRPSWTSRSPMKSWGPGAGPPAPRRWPVRA